MELTLNYLIKAMVHLIKNPTRQNMPENIFIFFPTTDSYMNELK